MSRVGGFLGDFQARTVLGEVLGLDLVVDPDVEHARSSAFLRALR